MNESDYFSRKAEGLLRYLRSASQKEMSEEQETELISHLDRIVRAGEGKAPKGIPPSITEEVLQTIPDDELAQYLHDFVLSVHDGLGWENESKTVQELPTALRAVYLVFMVESEVHNGGYIQYFGNNGDGFADETVVLLEKIGATEKARLTALATKAFRREVKGQEHLAPNGEVWRLWQVLEQFDSPFYAAENKEDVCRLLAAYVRLNPKEAVLDAQ